ncbi:hypothetical protein PBCVKS1B_492L [Paramecium bursaria Chlorella virus KS1B]|nr:hypothetical protein PBCVKS1B_492L [Paramecium bursaria Chlorella virus KS1B]
MNNSTHVVTVLFLVILILYHVYYIKLAYDCYLFGLPIVMNYSIMIQYAVDKNSGQYKAPFNVINNQHRVYTYKDTSIITPNSDTPYSMVWLDMRDEPIIISVPEVKDRYYSVQMVDSNTYNYGYIGSRTTGDKPGDYMISFGKIPDKLPHGIVKVYKSNTPLSLLIFRTQLFNAADMKNVIKIQNGYKVRTLSEYLGTNTAPIKRKPFVMVGNDIHKNFFEKLDVAMEYIPVDKYSDYMFDKLAIMGIGPRKKSRYSKSYMYDIGAAIASKVIDQWLLNRPKVNNWSIMSAYGNVDDYAGDWLKRAAVARGGIYANDADEAMYPITRIDYRGNKLEGSNNYFIDLKLDDLPPVKAFWSLTMYDGDTQLLIKNPLNRYLINSSMLGSLKEIKPGVKRIYIQNKSPGKDLETNWLPSPSGSIYLVLRMYNPSKSVLQWKPPFVCKNAST